MLKKVLASLLFLTLSLSVTPQVAFSAQTIKAGKPCNVFHIKANSGGKSFICIKLGSKLVWKRVKSPAASAGFLTPHPVSGKYGITWDNVSAKFNDIAAAAWTDAKDTIARNQNLPSASSGYVSYISPGALATDPKIGEAETYLKRSFAMFARLPASKKVIFIATTQEERATTLAKIDQLYPGGEWIKNKVDEIYGLSAGLPAGSVFTHSECHANDGARAVATYPDGRIASALIISVCPAIGNQDPHEGGVHGMTHEYAHMIQVAILVNVLDRKKYEPCWLREGGPEWAQIAVSNNFDEYLNNKHLHPYYLTSSGLNYENSQPKVWTTAEVDGYLARANDPTTCESTNEYALAYSLGAAAVETLVSIGGSESFFVLEQRLAKGQSANVAFKAVYGKTWDEIRPILAEVVARQITKSWDPDANTYQTRPM